MKNIKILKSLAIALFITAFATQAKAQNALPYSIYGLGSLYSGSNQINMALGGVTVPYSSPYFVNYENPASYMAFDSLSFVFNGSFYARFGTLKSATLTQKTTNASIADISFGFPVVKYWRTAFAFTPYALVNYEIHDEIKKHPAAGRIINIYKGTGGLNKAIWGNAFGYKNLSMGININYIFGNIQKESQATFPDSTFYLNVGDKKNAYAKGIVFDVGALYSPNFSKDRVLTLGLTFTPKQSISANSDKFLYKFRKNYAQDTEIVTDTISYQKGANDKIVLPTSVGFGLSYGSKGRWMAASDIKWQKWSEYEYLGKNGGLNDNIRFSLGGEFRPMKGSIGKYWERIYYRAGFRFEKTYLTINNKPINDVAFSIGFGLPMVKTNSTLNIALEAGTYGNAGYGSVKDTYFKITVGATLQEWLFKRRYF